MKKTVFGTLLALLTGGAFFSYKVESLNPPVKHIRPEVAKIVSSLGAGTAWASHGYLITAAHVCVVKDNSTLHLLINGEAEETHIIYFDQMSDLCVLTPTPNMPQEYEISSEIPIGKVKIVGMPGFEEIIKTATVTKALKDTMKLIPIRTSPTDGVILYSRVFKLIKGETIPGMSGGPAFDKDHKVVGLLTGGFEQFVVLADVRKLLTVLEDLK